MTFCPGCGKSVESASATFCPYCGTALKPSGSNQSQTPQAGLTASNVLVRKSHRARNIGIVFLILILVVVGASFALQGAQRAAIANIQVKSVTPSNIGVHVSGVSMNVDMVVHNPNGITATLDEVSYSVYANGNFVGSGQTTTTYNIPPQSDYTLTFPISMGWGSAFGALGSYILGGGHIGWELKGTDNVSINGLSFTVPFDYTSP